MRARTSSMDSTSTRYVVLMVEYAGQGICADFVIGNGSYEWFRYVCLALDYSGFISS